MGPISQKDLSTLVEIIRNPFSTHLYRYVAFCLAITATESKGSASTIFRLKRHGLTYSVIVRELEELNRLGKATVQGKKYALVHTEELQSKAKADKLHSEVNACLELGIKHAFVYLCAACAPAELPEAQQKTIYISFSGNWVTKLLRDVEAKLGLKWNKADKQLIKPTKRPRKLTVSTRSSVSSQVTAAYLQYINAPEGPDSWEAFDRFIRQTQAIEWSKNNNS